MAGELRYPCKVVIVTGGTRGIGEATMREFVRQGAKVVFCAPECERERGEALQRELEESSCPGEARFVICDVLCEKDIENLVSVTIHLYGCLDCLVNNAAIFPPLQEIDNVTAEDFRYVIDTNVVGYFLAAKYALPHLRKTKGNIINLSSIVAVIGYSNAIAYVASKVTQDTETSYQGQIDPNNLSSSILPGNILTPLWQRLLSEAPDPQSRFREAIDEQPLGRLGTPEEIALVALFLASEATFCTGADISVTGGVELGFGLKNRQETTKGIKD
ncbi:hypothetical protein JRQ81_005764 [Phrynocephalus forsythii]|uniref:17-beta-hydroxysteroid dehydrogenase 14 n=1 Tax=Phrynocephalus forsythii TaxID=171643 RepID=A0A9Q0XGP6_9SAUR|nr:hypothetical protein JRQ81_005764 [Phrynocephalus forsythii]